LYDIGLGRVDGDSADAYGFLGEMGLLSQTIFPTLLTAADEGLTRVLSDERRGTAGSMGTGEGMSGGVAVLTILTFFTGHMSEFQGGSVTGIHPFDIEHTGEILSFPLAEYVSTVHDRNGEQQPEEHDRRHNHHCECWSVLRTRP
jgi:hypothetical protein